MKFNHVVAPTLADGLNVISLIENTNTSTSIRFIALDLTNMFFSMPNHKEYQKLYLYMKMTAVHFTVLTQNYINPSFLNTTICKTLDHLDILQNQAGPL